MNVRTQLETTLIDAPRKARKQLPRAIDRIADGMLPGEAVQHLLVGEAIAGDPAFLVVTDRRAILALPAHGVDVDYSQLQAVDYHEYGGGGYRLVVEASSGRYLLEGKVVPAGQAAAQYLKTRIGGASLAGDMKVCPECAEEVKAAAATCRYCRHQF